MVLSNLSFSINLDQFCKLGGLVFRFEKFQKLLEILRELFMDYMMLYATSHSPLLLHLIIQRDLKIPPTRREKTHAKPQAFFVFSPPKAYQVPTPQSTQQQSSPHHISSQQQHSPCRSTRHDHKSGTPSPHSYTDNFHLTSNHHTVSLAHTYHLYNSQQGNRVADRTRLFCLNWTVVRDTVCIPYLRRRYAGRAMPSLCWFDRR